jgi:hypothetical protein
MRILCVVVTLVLVTSLSCLNKSKSADSMALARIKLAQNGTIFLNGNPASLEDVKNNLAQLKSRNGLVRVFRENRHSEVTPQEAAVSQAIADANLPVKFCASEEELNGTQ